MKKFEKWLSVHNTLTVALMLFWFVDLVLTVVKMSIGHSTMTPVDRKLLYLNGMVDFLWIFGLSLELTLKGAITKLYEKYLLIVDLLISVMEKPEDSEASTLTATIEKPEGLEEGVALKAE